MEQNVPNSKLTPGVFQGTPQEESKGSTLRVIRTMKSDASEAIRNQEETAVTIAMAEEKKRARQQAEAQAAQKESLVTNPPAPKPIHRFFVVLMVLLLIGLLVLGYIFVLPKLQGITLPKISLPSFSQTPKATLTVPTASTTTSLAPSIITADSEKRFDILKNSTSVVAQGIHDELQQGIAYGFVKNIYFTQGGDQSSSLISIDRFFAFENILVPEILTRSLENIFMVGLLGETGNIATPFVILKVSDATTGRAGMLEWEPTLPKLFNALFKTSVDISDSTSIKFHDVVVAGKDARMFTSPTGESILYAFANETTIIITKTQSALENLLSLAASK